jgi:hypothetical protein
MICVLSEEPSYMNYYISSKLKIEDRRRLFLVPFYYYYIRSQKAITEEQEKSANDDG